MVYLVFGVVTFESMRPTPGTSRLSNGSGTHRTEGVSGLSTHSKANGLRAHSETFHGKNACATPPCAVGPSSPDLTSSTPARTKSATLGNAVFACSTSFRVRRTERSAPVVPFTSTAIGWRFAARATRSYGPVEADQQRLREAAGQLASAGRHGEGSDLLRRAVLARFAPASFRSVLAALVSEAEAALSRVIEESAE